MKGKSAAIENRDLAFRIYCENGGNKEATVRQLEQEGLKISKPTLYDWIEKFNFDERMAFADLKLRQAQEAVDDTAEQLLVNLYRQKTKYESYFDSLAAQQIDNQAQYAYSGLLKTIIEIKSRIAADKGALFIDFMKDLVGFLSREDRECLPFIERNLDSFADYAREKYGK